MVSMHDNSALDAAEKEINSYASKTMSAVADIEAKLEAFNAEFRSLN